ncbi:MAG: hypothetical protein PHC56_13030 [Herbinix sp.]|nr:hypothetical protein [Herbinix sp.]
MLLYSSMEDVIIIEHTRVRKYINPKVAISGDVIVGDSIVTAS